MKKIILTAIALTATASIFAQATPTNTPRSKVIKKGVVLERNNFQLKQGEQFVKEEVPAPVIQNTENKVEETPPVVEEKTIKYSEIKASPKVVKEEPVLKAKHKP